MVFQGLELHAWTHYAPLLSQWTQPSYYNTFPLKGTNSDSHHHSWVCSVNLYWCQQPILSTCPEPGSSIFSPTLTTTQRVKMIFASDGEDLESCPWSHNSLSGPRACADHYTSLLRAHEHLSTLSNLWLLPL